MVGLRIELKNVDFAYGISPVLSQFNLSLDLRPTAIIGQNGAGKTTLVKLIKGLLKPQAGEILVMEKPLGHYSIKELAQTVGLVFQNPNDQIFKSRVIDEVMFGPLACGQSQDEAKENAKWALELVALSHHSLENPYDLSLSERKFVAAASVLAMKPKWVIFDEPTIAQDKAGKEKLASLIRHLGESGVGVTAILHDMDFAAEHFKRIVVMSEGSVRADGTPLEVFNQEAALSQAKVHKPQLMLLSEALGIDLEQYSLAFLEQRLRAF